METAGTFATTLHLPQDSWQNTGCLATIQTFWLLAPSNGKITTKRDQTWGKCNKTAGRCSKRWICKPVLFQVVERTLGHIPNGELLKYRPCIFLKTDFCSTCNCFIVAEFTLAYSGESRIVQRRRGKFYSIFQWVWCVSVFHLQIN